jgi:hypothetical protein
MSIENFETYCKECDKNIPVERLEDGTIIIHCPHCKGECLICGCHLVDECFGDAPKVNLMKIKNQQDDN